MKLEPHVKRIAIAVVLGAIMSVLSTTIVNVALQTLAVELGAPLDNVQWVVTGYMLSLAAVIPVSGWAAARFGARPQGLSLTDASTATRSRGTGRSGSTKKPPGRQ